MSSTLFLQPEVNKDGENVSKASAFQGTEKEKQRMTQVRNILNVAQDVRDGSYEEFDGRDVITVLNEGQNLFNANTPAESENPDEAWRANTKRPITRNKLVSIASNVLANLVYPKVVAQNAESNEDKEAALIGGDLLDYQLDQMQYPRLMKRAIVASLYSPATYLTMSFVDSMREIKEIQDDGSWKMKEVKDELFGGFQAGTIPCDEIYPTNIYEHNLQKQTIVRRQVIEFQQAKMVYGEIDNFEFVVPGVRTFFLDEEDSFFDQYDDSQQDRLVELVTIYDPFADLELEYINGIPMSDPDQPLKRKDKLIPIIKTGYELINERFFYLKSGAEKLMNDDLLLNDMWNMVMDGTFLSVFPPTAITGDEDVDSGVMIPGMTTTFSSENVKIQSLAPDLNLVSGLNAIQALETSMSESSVSAQSQGVSQQGTNTAFEVATLENNARSNLGLFISQVGELVEDFGDMLLPLILQHQTVAQGVQTMSDSDRLQFSSLLVREREVDGKKKSRRIDFTDNIPEEAFGEEVSDFEFEMLEEENKRGIAIAKVIPGLFRNLQFKVKVNTEPLAGKTDAVKKALGIEAYDRAIQNPTSDPAALLRDFILEPVKPGESDKYIREPVEGQVEEAGGAAGGNLSSQLTSQLTQGGKLGTAQLEGAAAPTQ